MKRLTIIRDETGDEGTFSIGMLTEGEQRLGWWNFIELPWRDNTQGISCIAPGLYIAKAVDSPRFRRTVYRLQNVPERDDIEMHPANWAGDKELGYYAQLEGCMSPGRDREQLVPPPPHPQMKQKAVTESSAALDEIFKATNGEDIQVDVSWERGVGP